MGIMFLGPVFGAPAALGRLAGAPENVVENLGQLGLDAASVVGVPGARGARRVIEPVPVKPVPTRVVRVTPVETGVFILRRSIKFSVKQLDKKFKHSKDFGVETTKKNGSMPFCVELDNLKDTDAPIHQPAAMLVAAD